GEGVVFRFGGFFVAGVLGFFPMVQEVGGGGYKFFLKGRELKFLDLVFLSEGYNKKTSLQPALLACLFNFSTA
ncbi:hypothetical protein KCA24_34195, partial [Escherichia coli]|nr:hypothetical protein [Escherichia coli]